MGQLSARDAAEFGGQPVERPAPEGPAHLGQEVVAVFYLTMFIHGDKSIAIAIKRKPNSCLIIKNQLLQMSMTFLR